MDDLFASKQFNFPKLANMPDIADLDVDGTAIAYDSSTPLIEIDNLKDNLLHVSVALTIQRLTNDGTKEIKDAQIKTQIVSENANALSWLFNKGIDFFVKLQLKVLWKNIKLIQIKKTVLIHLKHLRQQFRSNISLVQHMKNIVRLFLAKLNLGSQII